MCPRECTSQSQPSTSLTPPGARLAPEAGQTRESHRSSCSSSLQHTLFVQSLVDSIPAIKSAAEQLRPGYTVHIEAPGFNRANNAQDQNGVDLQGACNVHLPMEWNDGTRWLARVKIAWPEWMIEPRPFLADHVRNEWAYMQIARGVLGDLVPQAWLPRSPIRKSTAAVALMAANLHLLFVERVEGITEPLLMGGWRGPFKDGVRVPPPSAPAVLRDFPGIIEKISSTPFDRIGTFWPNANGEGKDPVLGPMLQPRTLSRPIHLHGPYSTFSEYVNSHIRRHLDQLDAGLVHVESHDPILYYLSFLELKNLVDRDPDMSRPEKMYIFHPDNWQFMFDAGRTRVVAVIDWE